MRFTIKQIQQSTARIAATSDGKPLTEIRPLRVATFSVQPVKGNPATPSVNAFRRKKDTPHDILWRAVESRWPGQARREYPGAVPGRRFRLDIAFPGSQLCLEVDGWQHHGMRLSDFIRDRERQNLLCIHGWRTLRFSAGMIRKDLWRQIDIIDIALRAR